MISLSFMMLLVSLLISFMLFMFNGLFYLNNNNMMKQLPFECGSYPFLLNYSHLSLKYFKMILLFLIFDVEFALILPSSFLYVKMFSWLSMIGIFILFNFLILSLYYELGWGTLDWTK